jgi:hypothetical protein
VGGNNPECDDPTVKGIETTHGVVFELGAQELVTQNPTAQVYVDILIRVAGERRGRRDSVFTIVHPLDEKTKYSGIVLRKCNAVLISFLEVA